LTDLSQERLDLPALLADPTAPITSWKTAWNSAKTTAGIDQCRKEG
jgi:hypothetical protein